MHKLRSMGTSLLLFGAIGPFLMVIKIIPSTMAFNFLTYGSMFIGGVIYFIGLIYDNLVDRSE